MGSRLLLEANDPWITQSLLPVSFFLAACLTGCTTVSTSPSSTTIEPARADSISASDNWDFCHDQIYAVVEPRLRANGQCGASNCFDDNGNSLQQLVVQRCGYPEHSAEETDFLMEMIQQAIKSKKSLASREIRTLYYYPPDHPASIAAARAQAIADEQRAKADEAEQSRIAALKIRIGSPLKDVLNKFGHPDDTIRIVSARGESLILRYGPLLAGTSVYLHNNIVTGWIEW